MTIEPLSPSLGAEVRGIDLAAPMPDEAFADILGAFHRHKLLRFAAQRIDETGRSPSAGASASCRCTCSTSTGTHGIPRSSSCRMSIRRPAAPSAVIPTRAR
jgi:hypothetical protein